MVGAEYLAAATCGGSWKGYYYEVEVLNPAGRLFVGFAGTNFGQNCTVLGGDEDGCSWGVRMYNCAGHHRCARGNHRAAYGEGGGIGNWENGVLGAHGKGVGPWVKY